VRPRRGTPGGRPPHQEPGGLKGRLSLSRALSKFGVCSRKEATRLVEEGRVAVGGRRVLFPARRIDPRRDHVSVDGAPVGDETERLTVALHKPPGYITSRTDPGGRSTVYELLRDLGRWVFPVGRLDRDTSGLLILTNDHRLGHRLTDPTHDVPKTYHARVKGLPEEGVLDLLRKGIDVGDGALTRPARVRVLGAARSGTTWLEIVLKEGKNRQVRRMCSAVGHDVLDLTRVAIGGLLLGDLAPGEWRRLAPGELSRLQSKEGLETPVARPRVGHGRR
jgi:pseudouridine synthase